MGDPRNVARTDGLPLALLIQPLPLQQRPCRLPTGRPALGFGLGLMGSPGTGWRSPSVPPEAAFLVGALRAWRRAFRVGSSAMRAGSGGGIEAGLASRRAFRGRRDPRQQDNAGQNRGVAHKNPGGGNDGGALLGESGLAGHGPQGLPRPPAPAEAKVWLLPGPSPRSRLPPSAGGRSGAS